MREIIYREEGDYVVDPCHNFKPKSGRGDPGICCVGSMACQFRCRYFKGISVKQKKVECNHEN